MNSSPSPYLNVTRLQSTQRGMSSTSSCSTFTHSTGPMPSGKSNTSGSENGSVVYQPRSRSQITGGFEALLDRRPDGEGRRELVALDDDVRAVADAGLVDLREQVVGRVAGEDVREAGLDADADEREQAGRLPVSSTSNWASPSFTPVSSYGRSGCGSDSVIAMSRYVQRASSAAAKIGGLKRGSTALRIASAFVSRASATMAAVFEASICAAPKRSGSPSFSTTASARASS